jgi:hypothetical protein
VAGVFECSAPGYACPISEGPSFGSYTFISGQTWRRERNVYGTVFIAVEVDIVPSAGTIYFRGYIKCSGTWAQVADLTYTGWDGTYPLSLIEQSLTVTDPNVDSMLAGLDLT